MLGVLGALVAQVSVNPNSGALPGGPQLQQVVDGLAAFALIGSVAGLIISAVVWAFGAHNHNPHHAQVGKKGLLFAGGSALLIGGAAGVINFMTGLGHQVH